jgi:predicted dienelactone hydrolase
VRVLTFVDTSRSVRYPGEAPQPRRLVTIVRYPAVGSAARQDVGDAAPERRAAPFPLVIFGHGFAVAPGIYAPLLRALAQAGYVVAAPVFPAGNANAPGGPNENDLVNQPGDMSFVITRLLALSAARAGAFAGLINRRRIAVSGQSDGGETALAATYDSYFRDDRIRAAAIFSGMKIPGVGGYKFAPPSVPLLAVQGTADTINPPPSTYAFFAVARRPKFLLKLLGASHLPPYTSEEPQLGVVARATIAFFDRYLRGDRRALSRLSAAARAVPGVAELIAEP